MGTAWDNPIDPIREEFLARCKMVNTHLHNPPKTVTEAWVNRVTELISDAENYTKYQSRHKHTIAMKNILYKIILTRIADERCHDPVKLAKAVFKPMQRNR